MADPLLSRRYRSFLPRHPVQMALSSSTPSLILSWPLSRLQLEHLQPPGDPFHRDLISMQEPAAPPVSRTRRTSHSARRTRRPGASAGTEPSSARQAGGRYSLLNVDKSKSSRK